MMMDFFGVLESLRSFKVLEVLGVLAALKLLLFAGGIVRRVLYCPPNFKKKYGSWAVVTGSTDGIGFEYARQLALKGMNVLLISRTQKKLDDCAAKIEQELAAKGISGVEIQTHAADFSANDDARDELYAGISSVVEDLDVGMLVNNVGMSYSHAEYFHLLEDSVVENLVNVNVYSTALMTKIVLGGESGGMIARKRGAIVNVTSYAGCSPLGDPLYTGYSAVKGFVTMMSRSMHYELEAKNIHVQCHVPWFVTTKLAKLRHASLWIPTPKTWVKSAISHIGRTSGGPVITPYASHAIPEFILESLPTFLFKSGMMSHHHDIRRRAYRKKERLAKEGKSK